MILNISLQFLKVYKYYFIFTFITLFLLNNKSSAQEKGDYDYVFKSLDEANERPEIVYHLNLERKKLIEFPKNLSRYENLRILNLNKNKISLLPAELGEISSLEILYLEKNNITVLPFQIKNLQNLTELHLSRNEIVEIQKEIGEVKNLKILDLWSNQIRKVDPAIQNLKNLEKLDMQGMVLSQEMMQNLTKWLPNTKLEFSTSCNCGF